MGGEPSNGAALKKWAGRIPREVGGAPDTITGRTGNGAGFFIIVRIATPNQGLGCAFTPGTRNAEAAQMRCYHLIPQDEQWKLTDLADGSVEVFRTKEEALRGCGDHLRWHAGSLKIHKKNGMFDEERIYLGPADPVESPGLMAAGSGAQAMADPAGENVTSLLFQDFSPQRKEAHSGTAWEPGVEKPARAERFLYAK